MMIAMGSSWLRHSSLPSWPDTIFYLVNFYSAHNVTTVDDKAAAAPTAEKPVPIFLNAQTLKGEGIEADLSQ